MMLKTYTRDDTKAVQTSQQSNLQAGVVAPGLLRLLSWRGVQPHEAVVPQDERGSAGEVVEVSLLPLDQGGRQLHQHTLAQLHSTGDTSV